LHRIASHRIRGNLDKQQSTAQQSTA